MDMELYVIMSDKVRIEGPGMDAIEFKVPT